MTEEQEQKHHFDGGVAQVAPRQRARRPTTDYTCTIAQWLTHRRGGKCVLEQERPSPSYIIDMRPPAARKDNPADTIPAKHLHSSLNKIKHPINVVKWTPEGRRLLTGSSSGEFTLWNGMGFNFETIMQAHDSAIRSVKWSHSADWLVSADHDGVLKYWQPNFNNVKAIQAHEAPIRDLAFAPTDVKFVTASDDASLKIWDFSGGVEESVLTGHGWDAKTVDWHPTKGLLASGSKDHQVKLWDPRTSRCLTTLHGHKNPISKVAFEPLKGQCLATCARDPTARIFDLRMMRDILLLRGHERDITTLTWHPIHPNLLSTGGSDGTLFHYILDEPNPPPGTPFTLSPYDSLDPPNAPTQTIHPAHRVPYAHDSTIWSLDWHPIGHILASGSNDRVTRFWTRPRPGDSDYASDRYHLGEAAAAQVHGAWAKDRRGVSAKDLEEMDEQDEAEGLVDQKMPTRLPVLPGLPGLQAAAANGSSLGNGDGTSTGGAQPNRNSLLPQSSQSLMNLALHPSPAQNSNPAANMAPAQLAQQIAQQLNLPQAGGPMPDVSKLAQLFGGQMPPLPPGQPGIQQQQGLPGMPGLFGFPPPPPGSQQTPPQLHAQPQVPPSLVGGLPGLGPGQQSPPNVGGYEMGGNGAAGGNRDRSGADPRRRGGDDGDSGGGVRKRAPLPSQRDSLREEMRQGRFRNNR